MAFKCWASGYCNKRASLGEDKCGQYCDGYLLLKALYSQANMPKRYQYDKVLSASGGDKSKFMFLKEYMENILDNVEEGTGLYIHSTNTGNGKTSWACKIMNYFFRKIVFNASLECEGLYLNVPTFLEDMRRAYNEPNEEFDKQLRDAKKCKILILDDIGSEKPTDWVQERLYTLINERVNNELVTIYTSNLPLLTTYKTVGGAYVVDTLGLDSRLDKRIVSRIKGSCNVVEFKGKDRREVE